MSLLQAEEYFAAARLASTYTSPNHLYYGLVAIASAVMLLLGDGTRSFDYLRRDRRNMRHGLDFSIDPNVSKASEGLGVLELAHIEVARHGHFQAWHSVLPAGEPMFALVRREVPSGTQTGMDPVGAEPTTPTDALVGQKFTLLRVMGRLPDLMTDLVRYGAAPIHTRANHEMLIRRNGRVEHTWRLHGVEPASGVDALLGQFRFPAHLVQFVNWTPADTSAGIVEVSIPPKSSQRFQGPSARSTIDMRAFLFAEPLSTHEFVDFYIAAFGLSMLARYYPDVWRACLESHCLASKLIESFVAWAIEKVPQLALSFLVGEQVVVSTHRPPWYD